MRPAAPAREPMDRAAQLSPRDEFVAPTGLIAEPAGGVPPGSAVREFLSARPQLRAPGVGSGLAPAAGPVTRRRLAALVPEHPLGR